MPPEPLSAGAVQRIANVVRVTCRTTSPVGTPGGTAGAGPAHEGAGAGPPDPTGGSSAEVDKGVGSLATVVASALDGRAPIVPSSTFDGRLAGAPCVSRKATTPMTTSSA